LHDGLKRLNSLKPRGDGDYTRSIAARTLHFASCPNSYMLSEKGWRKPWAC
jgi:hypothetical protein